MFVTPIMAYAGCMSGNHDILVLEFLRRLGAKVEALTGEARELRHRVTRVEQRLAALAATEALHHAASTVRLDRLQARLDRIEGRPEATDRSAEA
jgi:outer membrane murein-binding lipoprotein Lpp